MRSSMGAIPYGVTAAFILVSGSFASGSDPVFIEGDTPYLSEADSPWIGIAESFDYFHLENFEDALKKSACCARGTPKTLPGV